MACSTNRGNQNFHKPSLSLGPYPLSRHLVLGVLIRSWTVTHVRKPSTFSPAAYMTPKPPTYSLKSGWCEGYEATSMQKKCEFRRQSGPRVGGKLHLKTSTGSPSFPSNGGNHESRGKTNSRTCVPGALLLLPGNTVSGRGCLGLPRHLCSRRPICG